VGSKQWAVGSKQWAVGSGQWAVYSGHSDTFFVVWSWDDSRDRTTVYTTSISVEKYVNIIQPCFQLLG